MKRTGLRADQLAVGANSRAQVVLLRRLFAQIANEQNEQGEFEGRGRLSEVAIGHAIDFKVAFKFILTIFLEKKPQKLKNRNNFFRKKI
jgi:hypothetical protein